MLPAQVSVSNLLYNIRGSLYRHSLGRSQYVHIHDLHISNCIGTSFPEET